MREIKAGDLTIRGTSTAGVRTSLHVPQLKIVLDAGIAHPSFAKEKHIYLSHCHMDHIGALLALLGNRDLKRLGPPKVFVPYKVKDQVQALVDVGYDLGRFADKAEVCGVPWGCTFTDLQVSTFETLHSVPSNGYTFYTVKKKLLPKYEGYSGPQIAALRKEGIEVSSRKVTHKLSYITDTTSGVWEQSPEILKSEVLVMECTFIDDDKPVEEARKHGHIHLDEIAAAADLFKNKHIVLMHFSARYDNDEIQRKVDEKLPADLRERVQLLLPEDE